MQAGAIEVIGIDVIMNVQSAPTVDHDAVAEIVAQGGSVNLKTIVSTVTAGLVLLGRVAAVERMMTQEVDLAAKFPALTGSHFLAAVDAQTR